MRILIAEDDPTSRRILEVVLKKWGHEVVTTEDGAQAWEVLRKGGGPKLAILDWVMPGFDGVELCRKLREADPKGSIYIILLTARSSKDSIIEGLEAGADDFIVKPFDRDELCARIEVGCRVVALQSALEDKVAALEEALTHVKTLQGLLPICMHCHKIRTDDDAWQRLESYIESQTEATFSHSLCPDCFARHYPEDFNEYKKTGRFR